MKAILYSGVAFVALASAASAATCPAVIVGDSMGVGAGAFPQHGQGRCAEIWTEVQRVELHVRHFKSASKFSRQSGLARSRPAYDRDAFAPSECDG